VTSFAVATSIASFIAVALVAAAALLAAELPLDPLGTDARAATDKAGLSMGAARGACRSLICPGHAPSSASVAENYHRMIFRRRCG
jgi:hypothetical protein